MTVAERQGIALFDTSGNFIGFASGQEGALDVRQNTMKALSGGQSESVDAVTTGSVQTSQINTETVLVHPTVDIYFRQGSNPTAVNTGADQFLAAGSTYRLTGITPGNKLAFYGVSTSGPVYITPEV